MPRVLARWLLPAEPTTAAAAAAAVIALPASCPYVSAPDATVPFALLYGEGHGDLSATHSRPVLYVARPTPGHRRIISGNGHTGALPEAWSAMSKLNYL